MWGKVDLGELLFRSISWIVSKIGIRALLGYGILVIINISVTFAISKSIAGLDSFAFNPTILIGVFLGWYLAIKVDRIRWFHILFMLITGLAITTIDSGNMRADLFNMMISLLKRDWQLFQVFWNEIIFNIQAISTQLFNWWGALLRGNPVFSLEAVTFNIGMTIWGCAIWSALMVRKWGKTIAALLPTGLLLATTMSYSGMNVSLYIPFLALMILLMGFVNYGVLEDRWERLHIDYPLDIRIDVSVFTSASMLGILTLSVILSLFSIQSFLRFSRDLAVRFQKPIDTIAHSLGIQTEPQPLNFGWGFGFTGLPREHLIGSGPELSQRTAMVIQIDVPGSVTPAERYYWRSFTFDIYTNKGWASSPFTVKNYPAGTSLYADANIESISVDHGYAQVVHQRVTNFSNYLDVLFIAGELISADKSYRVASRANNDIFGAGIDSTKYQAISYVPVFGLSELRQANMQYPQWIDDRYLQLPTTIPKRVSDLADNFSQGMDNPLDIALSIEKYLRRIPYSLDVPPPPTDKDVADYFLFELKKGYCDYYATAMVVLARLNGLPARLVTGFASGAYDPIEKQYTVTEADAHSWVEIYFPGYGWITFEPTAGIPAIDRPPVMPQQNLETAEPIWFQTSFFKRIIRYGLMILGISILLSASILLLRYIGDEIRLKFSSPAETINYVYSKMYTSSKRLNVQHKPGLTPTEFTNLLAAKLLDSSAEPTTADSSSLCASLGLLIQDYNMTTYSEHTLDASEKTRIIMAWKAIRGVLRRSAMRQTLGNIVSRFR